MCRITFQRKKSNNTLKNNGYTFAHSFSILLTYLGVCYSYIPTKFDL